MRKRPQLIQCLATGLVEAACGRTNPPHRPTEGLWEAGSAGRLSISLWELAWQANCFSQLLSRARPAPTGKTQD